MQQQLRILHVTAKTKVERETPEFGFHMTLSLLNKIVACLLLNVLLLQMLEEEEDRLWQEQRESAYRSADEARAKFRQQFEVSAATMSHLRSLSLLKVSCQEDFHAS